MSSIHTENTVSGPDEENISPQSEKRHFFEENGSERDPTLEPPPEKKFFSVVSQEEQFNWSLPDDMAEYFRDNRNKFIPDGDLESSILKESPIPDNLGKAQVLDQYWQPLLSKDQVNLDKSLEKLHQKVLNVMGPLSKV